jgi:protein-tyrosine-phosphatase
MAGGQVYNILFLCTGNGAKHPCRGVDQSLGSGPVQRLQPAGRFPKGALHPLALDLLEKAHLDTRGLRSKSWDEFAKPGAPIMDFVFTVCDQAAGEVCPFWPGKPVTAHWGVPDPAAVEGPEADKIRAFRYAYQALETRIKLFTSLRLEALDRLALERKAEEIGHLRILPSGVPAQ